MISNGALKELLKAPLDFFERMCYAIPKSERKEIIDDFEKRVKVLEDIRR